MDALAGLHRLILRNILEHRTEMEKDVFISHASEDKVSVVIPFANELEKYGITYWLDMRELAPGDQLSERFSKMVLQSLIML